MLEIPEAAAIAKQINDTLVGKRIVITAANHSPHKFAWFHGDPKGYSNVLDGKTVENAAAFGGLVEIKAGGAVILLGDGANLRFIRKDELRPKKHQLLLEFDDGSAVSASVQMYGGIWCFNEGEFKNPYYLVAKEKPSPLSEDFNREYFNGLLTLPEVQKLSVKAFLATEQRIPGFGNGVLQDVLWKATLHPKRKVNSLSDKEKESLYAEIKSTLLQMYEQGGRDTEKDFYGREGGYRTVMSKRNYDTPCPVCGGAIIKENYMGGSVYYCKDCQTI